VPDRKKPKRLKWYVAIALLLALAVLFRVSDLEADPPVGFADNSQSFTTDPGHLTWHARDKALFGSWDVFGYEYWLAFRISAVSLMSYVLFSFSDVSRLAANSAGVWLNLLGIGMFLLALKKHVSYRVLTITALLIATNFPLMVYARLPFSENGLLFLAALTFLVYSYTFHTWPGKVLVGVLVGLCALLGKSFGLLFILPPLASLWISSESRKAVSAMVVIAAASVPLLLFEFVWAADSGLVELVMAATGQEQVTPGGFQSLTGFFEHAIGFAVQSQFVAYYPILCGCLYFLLLQIIRGSWASLLSKPDVVFLLTSCLAFVFLLSPFNYVPLRYFVPIVLPLCALAAITLDALLASPDGTVHKPGAGRLGLMLILNWMMTYYVLIHVIVSVSTRAEHYAHVWYALPPGILVTLAQWLFLRRADLAPASRPAAIVVGSVLLVAAGLFVYRTVEAVELRTYGIAEAAEDIPSILADDAVLSGPYGPALAADSDLKTLPYYVPAGGEREDGLRVLVELGKAYPITHLAVGKPWWRSMVAAYPRLGEVPVVARYLIRDVMVYIVRVDQLFGNSEAADYVESDFERAVDYLARGADDSAATVLTRFLAEYPESKAGLLERYYQALQTDGAEVARPYIDRLLDNHGTDFTVLAAGAMFYRHYARVTGEQTYDSTARELLERAVLKNPRNEQTLRDAYAQDDPALRFL